MYLHKQQYIQLISQPSPLPSHVIKMKREVDVSYDIATRAANIIGINPKQVEPLQLVRYMNPKSQYTLHHDHGKYYNKNTEHRSWTMLIFLNNVSNGGYTSFPKLQPTLEIIPTSGDALIWSNIMNTDDGNTIVDPDMVHMGLPPGKDGIEKYAVNVWFSETIPSLYL